MRYWLILLCSCFALDLGQRSSGVTKSDAAAGATDGGEEAETGPMGADCVKDVVSGAVLCTYISLCPELGIDHDLYPDCGFRMHGAAILDLECWCDGMLCPIGVATTCAQAKSLLASQSQLTVCSQVNEGRCTH